MKWRAFQLAAAAAVLAAPTWAQAPSRKIGELELQVLGIQASADPANPTVPKNIASAIRVVVTGGGKVLDAAEVASFLSAVGQQGAPMFLVEAELSGPGLRQTITIPQRGPEDPLPADPLLLPLPPLNVAGDYTVSNLRLVVGSRSVLDVQPQRIPLKIIDQILVTAVKARPLTLDEIREKGIVLDSDDYLGFDFSLGLKLESSVVNVSFPVVFDRQGVVVPQPPAPPDASVNRGSAKSPGEVVPDAVSILPVMMTAIPEDPNAKQSAAPLTLYQGQPVRIPSVLVIPGNVGYLKQFFSAQLFVANGAPVGAPLTLREVKGTIKLPMGPDQERGGDNVPESDDPLVLATTVNGPHPETLPVRGVGPDGAAGTADDAESFAPGEQGQAEFVLRGDKEGFHSIDIDIRAVLDGLPVGPVKIGGKAQGGVLVRNPSFDVSFAVPSTVRTNEKFKVFMTISNVGQGAANDLTVTLDQLALAGAKLLNEGVVGLPPVSPRVPGVVNIPTIQPGQARVAWFEFKSENTGAVVASYLGFDGDDVGGSLKFKLGVGELGVPLSPDTLALPAAVDELPEELVEAAMRVLGQAWSLAGAPPGSLPPGVTRTSRAVVQQKALALAEAGLRVELGEPLRSAVADLVADFFSPRELDPGFDQLLRGTEAGRDLARALGVALEAAVEPALAPLEVEESLANQLASGADFVSFATSAGAPVEVTVTDALGRKLVGSRSADEIGTSAVPGGALLPYGAANEAPFLGLLSHPLASPYTIDLSGATSLAVTLPRGDGSFRRAVVESTMAARVVVDLARPESVTVLEDANGDGAFDAPRTVDTTSLEVSGPVLLSASVIGPESFASASQFGTNFALLFDRPVDATTAAALSNYQVPANHVLAAKRQMTGRLVFGTLAYPEGPLVPTQISVSGIADERGRPGSATTEPLNARFDPEGEGGGVVIGRVVNADGTPSNGGTILYTNTSNAQCDLGASPTTVSAIPLDDEAAYQIRYVSRNKCNQPFELAYQDPRTGGLRKVAGLVRYDGEQLVMDIALVGRGSVTGVVKNLAELPAPGASVAVMSETDANTNKVVVADGEGRYLATDVAVGVVSVKAGLGLGLGFGAGRIDRSGNTATVNVTLDTGAASKLTGTVFRLETNGQLTPLVSELMSYIVQNTVVGYAYSGVDGKFQFENMPTGTFVIRASRGGFAIGVAGQTVVNVVVEAAPPGAVLGVARGTVVLPDGTPASRVVVAKDVSSFMIDGGVALGPGGSFEFPDLPVGVDVELSAITMDRKRTGRTRFQINPDTRVAEDIVIRLSGMGDVEFTVFDPNGVALPNVEVALVDPGGPLTRGACANPCGCRAQLTDANGKVVWHDMPLGAAVAQAIRRGAGFFDVVRGTASVTLDGEPGVGVLRFAGTGSVYGEVSYPAGSIGGGGDVTLTSNVFRNDGTSFFCGLTMEISHRGQIDPATGKYQFTGVNLGPVFVTSTNPFFPTPVGASGTLTQNGQELELKMAFVDTMAGELTGTVLLPDGLTPAGAGVEVTADGASLQNVTVRTNAGGKYKFAAVLPAGSYTITARDAATGGVARGTVYLAVSRPGSLDLRLKSRGIVRVSVVDGADQPVDKAFVKLAETEFPNKSYEGAIEPGSQGVVVFDHVYEGPFSVEAKGPTTGGRASSVLPRIAGSSVEIKVRLAVTGRVRGVFKKPNGDPVPFGVVTLKSGNRTLGQTTTSGRVKPAQPDPPEPPAEDELPSLDDLGLGEYFFDFVPAGAFRLDAEDPLTTRTGFAVGTIVGQDQTAKVDVIAQGLGTVEGTVTSNGQPWTTGARVVVVSGSFRATTFTDGAGNYVIEGVPEGRVDVTASPSDGFLTGTAAKTLEGDATTVRIDVALRDSGTLTGHVVRAGGETAAPPSIVSISVGGLGGGNQTATTDPEGFFQFDRVPAGRATLTVDVLGSVDRARMTVEVPSADTIDVTVPLNGVGKIGGHAKDSNGQPVGGLVQVTGTGDFPWGQTISVPSNGEFAVHDALAGPFTVSLTANEGTFTVYGKAAGSVNPDETTPIDVQLQKTGTVKGVVHKAGGTPATGAEVTIQLDRGRGTVVLYAGGNGSFEALGVPIGLFTLRVFDPVTTGRLVSQPTPVLDVEPVPPVDFGTLVLDESAPTVEFVEPQAGITRGRFAGPLTLTLGNTADLDPDSLQVVYPNGAVLGGLVISGDRATGVLSVPNLKVGKNVLRARVKDRTGNEGEAEVSFTLTGGTIHGVVLYADDTPAKDVPVELQGPPAMRTSAVDGSFSKSGVAPGIWNVVATDPVTGFRTNVGANLPDGENQSAFLEIRLPAYGKLAGKVENANRTPAFGVKVQLGFREATSGIDGRFTFQDVLVGPHTLIATATNGDKGSASVEVERHGHVAPVTIPLNGVGDVEVLVLTSGGQPSSGATVVLTGGLGYVDSKPTNSLGRAFFSNVLAGSLRAVATDTRGATGEAPPSTLPPDGSRQLTVDLIAIARVQGRVFRHDGSVAPDVTVEIFGAKTGGIVTDGGGNFAFDNVSGVTGFELLARDLASEDRGYAAGQVVDESQPLTANVTLLGTGAVRVTLQNRDGQPVKDADVRAAWSGRFGATRFGTTDETGAALVGKILAADPAKVLAGDVTLTAFKGSLSATPVTLSVPAGATVPVPMTLELNGTVRGVVYEPDGTTPAEGVKIDVGVGTFVTTGSDGVYEFADLKLNVQYGVAAYRNERLRAVGTVTLTEQERVRGPEPPLKLIGVGTVTGMLRDASSAPVFVHPVSLTSLVPVFGGLRSVNTDLTGRFTFTDVPVGGSPIGFTLVSTRVGSERADGEGKVTFHGETVPLDLKFIPASVTLPWSLYDANSWLHTMPNADGRLDAGGLCGIFVGGGALRLSLVHQGTTLPFLGSGNTVPTEENKRELVFRQTLAGLEVTRKLFVPKYGYFARMLDTLRNDGDQPVTVDVVHETFANSWRPDVVDSSSGDAQPAAPDRWVVIDDVPELGNSCYFPPVALAFGGAAASQPATDVEHERTATSAKFVTRWRSLVVPAHSSVALMQALSPQNNRTRGTASAARLSDLPPELLEGLSPSEAQTIVNYAVPETLQSTLEALPPLDGEITGRVLSGDGATLVPGASITFESRSLHYHIPLHPSTSDGTFRIASDLVTSNPPRVVPLDAFDLKATYTGVQVPFAAQATGGFGPGSQTTTQDVVFADSGAVEGRVLRSDGSVVNASVVMEGPAGAQIATLFGTPQRFRLPLVIAGAAGTYTLRATHPAGGVTVVANDFAVTASQKTVRDLTFVPFGSLTGTVRSHAGVPTLATMTLRNDSGFNRSGFAAGGTYLFQDVPAGTYTLQAQDFRNSATVSREVEVVAGTTSTGDVTLAPMGQVFVTATVNGAPLKDARASWQSEARGPAFVGQCVTNAAGQCTLPSVSGPSVRVRAEYPGVPESYGETTVALPDEGQLVDAPVSVPGVGTVTGVIRSRNGVALPAQGIGVVSLYHATDGRLLKGVIGTDAAGRYTFTNVPVAPLRLRLWRIHYAKTDAFGELTGHGQVLNLDVTEPVGVLETTGQKDLWRATFAQGQPIDIWAEAFAVGETAALPNPYLELFGPDGRLVASNDNAFFGFFDAHVAVPEAPLAGSYVIAVSTRAAGSGGYRIRSSLNDEAHLFAAYDGPTLSGRVTRHDDGAAVPGQRLDVTLPNGHKIGTASAADGRYLVPLFGFGTATTEAFDPAGLLIGRSETAVVATDSAALDISVPARGLVQVTVSIGVQKLAGVPVTFTSNHPTAFPDDKTRSATTGSQNPDLGVARATLPAGAIVARAQNPSDGQYYETSGLLSPDGTLILDLAFAADTAGTLRGVVRGRLGAVAIGGATVSIPGVPPATTDMTGAYRFDGLAGGTYEVTAEYQDRSQPLTVNVGDTPVFQDFELALDSLGGRIQEPDGTGVAASVRVCSFQSPSFSQLCSFTSSAADGTYLLHGLRGDYPIVFVTATVSDGSGLQATANTTRPTGLGNLDATLPVTGSIVGFLRQATGEPVPNRGVTLQRKSDKFGLQFRNTDAEGRFRIPHVLPQQIRLVGSDADGIPGEAFGTVVGGQELSLDLTLMATGVVHGRWVNAAQQPLAGRTFSLQALETVESFFASGQLDSAGEFTRRVPVGPYRVEFSTFQGDPPAAHEGLLVAGAEHDFTAVAGSHVLVGSTPLGGPLGNFRDDFACAGPPCVAWPRMVITNGSQSSGIQSFLVTRELESRGLRFLLESRNGVRYRQLSYVPPSGAFSRSLLLLTNPTAAPLTVQIEDLLHGFDTYTIAATSNGDAFAGSSDSYVVARRTSNTGNGDFALVTGNLLPVNWWLNVFGGLRAFINVTLGPGETLGLLSFSAARPQADQAALIAQAAALADLSDPDALVGLSDADKASIVNFVMPGTEKVTVNVTRSNNPISNYFVSFESARPDLPVEARFRSALTVNGTASAWLPPGDVSVRVTDSFYGTLASASGTLALGAPLTLPVALTPTPRAALSFATGGQGAGVGSGYAFRCDGAITGYELRVDGSVFPATFTPVSRPDVRASFLSECPSLGSDVGFEFRFDANQLSVGQHSLFVVLTDDLGGRTQTGTTQINVQRMVRAALERPSQPSPDGEPVVGGGWAFSCTRSIASYTLVVDGADIPEASFTTSSRPDVANLYRDACPSLSDTVGFEFSVPANVLLAGQHLATVRYVDSAGATHFTPSLQIVMDPALRHAGTLEVRYFDSADEQSQYVCVEAPEAPRLDPNTPWTGCLTTTAAGQAPASLRVPAGAYRVLFTNAYPYAAAEGVLAEDETQEVRLQAGTHIHRANGPAGPFVEPGLAGVDAFHYVVKPEQGGRAMRSLLATGAGLRVRRQEFRPASDAFRRTLTLVTNPGTEPVTVSVGSTSSLGNPEWQLHATSVDDGVFGLDDTYAVAVRGSVPEVYGDPLGGDDEGTGRGIVFGSLLAPEAVSFSAGSVEVDPDGATTVTPGVLSASHSLTIPPGETRAILAFAVHGVTGAEALARAQALADLGDPEALVGLSASDRQAIVNFALPPLGQLSGVVKTPANETVANAPVGVLAGTALIAETLTDAGGSYSFTLDVGDYAVVAFDSSSNRPGRRVVAVTANAVQPGDITLLADAELGSVRATGDVGFGEPVRVEVGGYWPFWSASAPFTGSDATISGVPAGTVTARVVSDPMLQAHGELTPGGLLELALVRVGDASVGGQVVDSDGGPLPNARVALFDGSMVKLAEVVVGADARFSFTNLLSGNYLIAAIDPATRLSGSAWIYLDESEHQQIQVVVLDEPAMGTLKVRGVMDATGLPAVGATVTLESLAYPGFWVEQATLDANGEAVVTNVPADEEVSVSAGATRELGYVVAGATLEVTLRIGETRSPFPIDLSAAGDLTYFAWPSIVEANTDGPWTCDPFCTGYSYSEAAGQFVAASERAQSAVWREGPEGREASVRLWSSFGLQGSRRFFVPTSGGFVRVLDVLENTTAGTLDVSTYVDQYSQGNGAGWSLGTTSSSDSAFDLLDDYATVTSASADRPELAWVIAGPGSRYTRSGTSAELYDDGSWSYAVLRASGTLTLAPGQKAILMRFTAQKPHGETAEIVALAEALRSLDPPVRDAALALMTPQERAAVVNFVVPQP